MNQSGIVLPKLIAIVFLVIVSVIVCMIVINLIPEEKPNYVTYEESDNPEIILNGGYVVYTEMNGEYEELGASAYTKDGRNISNLIQTSVYEDNRVRSEADTSKFTTYRIFYSVSDPDNSKLVTSVSRVVKIVDREAPKITLPTTVTITKSEVNDYDLKEGIEVTDNSGDYDLSYEGTLKEKAGDYIITYTATDKSGNKTVRKRLIKVTN